MSFESTLAKPTYSVVLENSFPKRKEEKVPGVMPDAFYVLSCSMTSAP